MVVTYRRQNLFQNEMARQLLNNAIVKTRKNYPFIIELKRGYFCQNICIVFGHVLFAAQKPSFFKKLIVYFTSFIRRGLDVHNKLHYYRRLLNHRLPFIKLPDCHVFKSVGVFKEKKCNKKNRF